MGTVTHTLIERVDELVQPSERELTWGNPLLSTTPSTMVIRNLAVRVEALEEAMRELALAIQTLLDDAEG